MLRDELRDAYNKATEKRMTIAEQEAQAYFDEVTRNLEHILRSAANAGNAYWEVSAHRLKPDPRTYFFAKMRAWATERKLSHTVAGNSFTVAWGNL